MKTFHKYIFWQIFTAALLGILFFVFVLVMGNAMREVFDKLASSQISWGTFFYFIFLLIPGVIPYAFPLGLLTAILVVLGRLSSQNEITAARASGISITSIVAPAYWVALFGVLMCLLINMYYAPLADTLYKRKLYNIIRDNPLHFIQPKTFIHDFPGYVIYVTDREDKVLRDFWIWELDAQNRVSLFIKGKRGAFSFDELEDAITLKVFDGIAEKRPEADPEAVSDNTVPTLSFKDLSFKLPLSKILGSKQGGRKLAFYTFDELLEERSKAMQGSKESDFKQQIKVQLEIQKKWVMAFSIFSLAFIAVPLGIRVGRSEKSMNVVLALILALFYYTCLVLLSWTEDYPHWRPDLLIWIPNILFQSVGVWLLLRIRK